MKEYILPPKQIQREPFFECHGASLKSDFLLFNSYQAMGLLRSAPGWICDNSFYVILSVILVLVLYVIYKSYWSPVLYTKELTEVGFEHIPPGPDRAIKIKRAQSSRSLGGKLPPPYPNGWFAVAETIDLKSGGVVAVDALGQNLCVYRGEDGVARCVDAYCPHLGAHLGVGGKVQGSCIECPFHKWKFGADGSCVSVPGVETAPKGVSIRTWHTAESDGAIWIWYDASGSPPTWSLASAEEQYAYRGANHFTVASHVQDIPENGADVAHLNAVHSPSLLTDLGEKCSFLQNFIGRHVWSAEWCKGDDHTAVMTLQHDYKLGKLSLFHMDVRATQIGPGKVRLLVKTSFGPILIVQSVTPLSPLLQKVIHRIYSPAYNAPIAAAFVRGESYMFERDVAIWNSKRYVSSPAYVRTDKTIRAFRSWYSQFYSEKSISFRDAIQKPLEW